MSRSGTKKSSSTHTSRLDMAVLRNGHQLTSLLDLYIAPLSWSMTKALITASLNFYIKADIINKRRYKYALIR